MPSTVICLGPTETGPCHLRVVDKEEELTLPMVRATQDHRNYILGTWVKSYANTVRRMTVGCTKGTAHTVPLDVYLANEPKVAEALWEKVWVVTGDDGYAIHSWVCGEQGRLWHVYVPPLLRGKGVASALIKHVCGPTYHIARPWPFNGGLPGEAVFNPYMLGEARGKV